jgi:hypothetical protein
MFSRVLTLFAAGLIALASLGAVPALAQDAASAPPVAAQEAAPAAPAAAVGTETKENPYGLMNLIKNGHAVDQIVLGILLFMSAGSWVHHLHQAVGTSTRSARKSARGPRGLLQEGQPGRRREGAAGRLGGALHRPDGRRGR